MNVKCIVACINSNGSPDFFACTVECDRRQYNTGEHYEMAERLAQNAGYENTDITYDENDGPAWLFERFEEIQRDNRQRLSVGDTGDTDEDGD